MNLSTHCGIRLFIVLLVSCYLVVHGAQAAEAPAGKIVNVRGQVEINGEVKKAVVPGQLLYRGDVIRTGRDGWVALLLADETLVQMNRNSHFTLQEVGAGAGWNRIRRVVETIGDLVRSRYRLNAGEGWFRNKNRGIEINIEMPTVALGMRGTEVALQVAHDGTATVVVLEGEIGARNDLGALTVRAGEQVVARRGLPLLKTVLLTPEDAVQWTIPIPPLFDERGAPPEVLEAWQELHAGQVLEARQRLLTFTASSPQEAAGWNLLALTQIMLGRPGEALAATERAQQAAPALANSFIIRSYAFQALFDLDQAVAVLKQALSLEETNVLALVNLARLHFGMDMNDKAKQMLAKAAHLAPLNAEVQNLQGFLSLAGRLTEEAISFFRRALELDASLAEPHMGLGLAYMRQGKTALALEEITAAVVLEPRRSLFLSYWGKMLYQIGRFDKALEVLKTASLLDPRDPTPEFYRAIILRDLNRPTEAIGSLNRAMALNDNRAVYRSRFLLDRDLASKNVDLFFLYSQLGLTDWARNKATASVKQDYTNASGHLFLGGAFGTAGDRSQASAGEYLLARLFESANENTFNTYNEYTSFFEKPALGGTVSGRAGNNGARGGDLVTYGALPERNVAFGTQLSYDETDGWRDTNGQRLRNLVVLAKWDASPKDSFLGVVSHQITNQRDKAAPRFEFDDPASPGDFLDTRLTRLELGYRRHLSHRSDLLVYLARMDFRGELFNNKAFVVPGLAPFDVAADFRQPNYQAQAEYLFKVAGHQLILGTTQYRGENIMTTIFTNGPISGVIANEPNLSLEGYFLSDTWKVSKSFIMEGAVYFDRLQDSNAAAGTTWQLNQWSPRLGFIFTPTRQDTLRLAVFRYLSPFIASRIDPMDVAGVPVFRNFREGSRIDEIDAVWEREWSRGYLAFNLFYLEKKFEHLDATPFLKADFGRMKGLETVLNQLISSGFGLVFKYRYQDVVDETSLPGVRGDREDHLASASLRYRHHSGLSSSLTETYRYERFKTGNWKDENIWLTDAAIGYEFPNKRGSVNLEMRNIFNQHFNWIIDQFVFAGRAPSREAKLTLSLNF